MQASTRSNPFVMMTDPETILQAVERSERLNRLSRKVYRPLDRPLIPKVGAKDLADLIPKEIKKWEELARLAKIVPQ